MSKMLGCLVAIAAVVPAAAHAVDINCLAPVVSLGSPGNSSGVRVAVDENGLAWQVFHDLSDGRVISRADQYQVTDERDGANGVNPFYGWIGLLKRNRNLMMIGKLYNQGGLFYEEKLIDFGHDPKGDSIHGKHGLLWAGAACCAAYCPEPYEAIARPASNCCG